MPQMMAIGDSLFNGVRSLTISEGLAAWSAPAQVARALGVPFVTPNYPRHVVINFEQWVRQPATALDELHRNIRFWDAQPPSTVAEFDNLAIASTTYADMYARTWRTAQAELTRLHNQLGQAFFGAGDHLAKLFFAFNTRFVLNPAADPAAPAETPLQAVARRKPARLLVSIGANNGLWDMGFAAKKGGPLGAPGATAPYNAGDVTELDRLFVELDALPPEVEHIYINALPWPSRVADMMPFPDVSDTHKPGAGRYYDTYENGLGFNYGRLTRAQMQVNDGLVDLVNQRVRAKAAASPRNIHVVPVDRLFADYDFKTDGAARTYRAPDGKTVSNIMLDTPDLFSPRWRGGFMGLDGMHPTILGYALMAQAILDEIQVHEGLAPATPIDLDTAYQSDGLLQNPPSAWDAFYKTQLSTRRLFGRAPGLGLLTAAAIPTTARDATTAQVFDLLQFKIN